METSEIILFTQHNFLILIQVTAGIISLFHFIGESYSALWMDHSCHSLIEGNMHCSQFLAIMTRAAKNSP